MKKLSVFIIITLLSTTAHAAKCTIAQPYAGTCDSCKTTKRKITCPTATYCDCASCEIGLLVSNTVQISSTESYTYNSCGGGLIPMPSGECPDECPDTNWTNVSGKNYQARCDNSNSISPTCQYRCKIGYYGTGTSCTRCPYENGIYGTTATLGATAKTECYIPSGTSFSDSTGSGIYSGNSYYCE